MICFSLAVPTSTLLHRNLIPLSAGQGRPQMKFKHFILLGENIWKRRWRGLVIALSSFHHFLPISVIIPGFALARKKSICLFSFCKMGAVCYFFLFFLLLCFIFSFFLPPSLGNSLLNAVVSAFFTLLHFSHLFVSVPAFIFSFLLALTG